MNKEQGILEKPFDKHKYIVLDESDTIIDLYFAYRFEKYNCSIDLYFCDGADMVLEFDNENKCNKAFKKIIAMLNAEKTFNN